MYLPHNRLKLIENETGISRKLLSCYVSLKRRQRPSRKRAIIIAAACSKVGIQNITAELLLIGKHEDIREFFSKDLIN